MGRVTVAVGALLCVAAMGAARADGQRNSAAPPAAVSFRDVTAAAGLDFRHVNGASAGKHFYETMGSGGLFFDFDADGWIDILLVDGGSVADAAVAKRARHRLYRNRGDGTFADVTTASGIRHRDYGMGACAGDYDNDGRVDLYITNAGANALYRNAGEGRFADVTKAAGVGSARWGTSCAFLDMDRDGDLDLFVTNYVDMGKDANRACMAPDARTRVYCHPLNFAPSPNVLYRNDGKGTFADATVEAGLSAFRGNGLGVAVGDYDDDLWPDVFVANDAVPNFLFHNEGKGTFTETALVAGVAVTTDGQARAGMGTGFADYDADGRLDLVVTNHETEMHSLFRNLGDGLFADVTVASGVGPATLPYVGFGVVFADYDNDADLDLAIVNGHVIDNVARVRSGGRHAQRRLLLQNTAGRFRDVSAQAGPGFAATGVGRGLAAGDVDNDGDLDLLITSNGGAATLLRNEAANSGHAIALRLIGTKSSRDALGARVRVTAGGRTLVREIVSGVSYMAQSDTRAHLGLGTSGKADLIEVRWPSGQVEQLRDVPADRILTIREGEGILSAVPFARGS